jgi:16S rRNA (guanine527-N7)-methyltransferase
MVARETSLLEEITRVFSAAGIRADPARIDQVTAFAGILLDEALPAGFIGPHEADRLVGRHLVESAALAVHLADGLVIDVGSGAGLPGLVLACLGREVVLIESLEKRATFLGSAIGQLGMDRVSVRNVRAEDAGRSDLRASAGSVVARALAAPPVALELCLPLARVGGRVLLATTPEAVEDVAVAKAAEVLGGGPPAWATLSVPGADPPRCVMIVDKVHQTPDRFPRRAGVPKRRPLG